MKLLLLSLITLLLFSACKDSSTSETTSTYEQYVKETETGLPLSVIPSQTILFNLEAAGNASDVDSGGDGFDEYTLELQKDETKRFCLGEDTTNISVEVRQGSSVIETIESDCKEVSLNKGEYLIRLISTHNENRLLHVEHRSAKNYTTMAVDIARLDQNITSSQNKKRASVDELYSLSDTIMFQTASCNGCSLYDVNLSHYNFGNFPSSSKALSSNFLSAQNISYDELKAKYSENTQVPAYFIFKYADLRDANMSYSVFNNIQFFGSDLEGADFSHSVFKDCGFSESNLKNTNFEGSIFLDTTFTSGSASEKLVRSKPSIISMKAGVIKDEAYLGFKYSATALAVLMSDSNIYLQPTISSVSTLNLGSPKGRQIISHPTLSWWASGDKDDYYNDFVSNLTSDMLVYVVTDDGGLYYSEYKVNGLDSNFESRTSSNTWTQLNDASTPCISAPTANTSINQTNKDFTLSTQVSCKKDDTHYYQWDRMMEYNSADGLDDSHFSESFTFLTPASGYQKTGVNTSGVSLFSKFNSDNSVEGIYLENSTEFSKNMTSQAVFSADANTFIDFGTYIDSTGETEYFAVSTTNSGLTSTLLRGDFYKNLTHREAYKYTNTGIFTTLISGVDVSSYDSYNEKYDGYATAIGSKGVIHLFNFTTLKWSEVTYTTSSSFVSSSSAISGEFEGTNFSNTYFGQSSKNSSSNESATTVNDSKVLPKLFDGVDGVYLYNFYLSDSTFTFNDISGMTFEKTDVEFATFSGTISDISVQNSTFTCNTLDNSVISNWSMSNSTWAKKDTCINSATNVTLNASVLAPTLSADELLMFELKDATNISALATLDYVSKDLSGLIMTYADITGSEGNFTDLSNSIWDGSTLSNFTCNYCNLLEASFLDVSAQNVVFSNSYLVGTILSGDFTNVAFDNSQLDGITVKASTSLNLATFSNVTTNGLIPNHTTCTFDNVNLSGASFSGVYLQDCSFNGANLSAIKTFNDSTFVQNDFTNAIVSGGRMSFNNSLFYGSCFDGIVSSSTNQNNTTFTLSGSVTTDLVYNLLSDTTYADINVTYKLLDSCINYEPN